MKRLPTDRQLDAILSTLAKVDPQEIKFRLSAAIDHDRKAGSPHDGWGPGDSWDSSTERAALARIDGHRGDWQRQEIDRIVERLVRAVAELSWVDADLRALRARQTGRSS